MMSDVLTPLKINYQEWAVNSDPLTTNTESILTCHAAPPQDQTSCSYNIIIPKAIASAPLRGRAAQNWEDRIFAQVLSVAVTND